MAVDSTTFGVPTGARTVVGRYGVRTYSTATQWEDLRFPATGINPPGADSDPTLSDTSGLLEFSKSAVNTIIGVAQMPHSWLEGSSLHPHIHVTHPDDGAGNTIWRLSYKLSNINGTYPATFTDQAVQTFAAPENATKHSLFEFPEIVMTGYTLSSCVIWKLSRVGNNDGDTYDDVLSLI